MLRENILTFRRDRVSDSINNKDQPTRLRGGTQTPQNARNGPQIPTAVIAIPRTRLDAIRSLIFFKKTGAEITSLPSIRRENGLYKAKYR